MSEEIQEMVQIVRLAYEGVEIVMKVGSGGIGLMQKGTEFLKGMLDYEKILGKTSMKRLLMKGGDLQILQFKTEDMKKVKKLAKKYGILYSVLPDVNKKDGFSEIIFHSEAVPRANMMIQNLSSCSYSPLEDYLKNTDKKGFNKLLDFFKSLIPGNSKVHTEAGARTLPEGFIEKVGIFAMEKQSISLETVKENFSIDNNQANVALKQLETMGVISKEDKDGQYEVIMDKEDFQNHIQKYQDLTDRMKAASASKNSNLLDVTISKTMINSENDHAIKTRVPGTWGEDVRYVWIEKENVIDIHGGKTLLTFFDKEKDYKIFDKENQMVGIMKGEMLYSNHYDVVEEVVRKKYGKTTKRKGKKKKEVKKRK